WPPSSSRPRCWPVSPVARPTPGSPGTCASERRRSRRMSPTCSPSSTRATGVRRWSSPTRAAWSSRGAS
ncbi:MAG: Two-component transcriptional response regulator, LuxR family, partial [uncultured Thermomicrobiales bacterium]